VDALEVGAFRPKMVAGETLIAGEVGYVATGLKNVRDIQVGDTITHSDNPATAALPGYRPAKPMVFAGFYPVETNDYPLLRDALDKLKLNDASLTYDPETSAALYPGGILRLPFYERRRTPRHQRLVEARIHRGILAADFTSGISFRWGETPLSRQFAVLLRRVKTIESLSVICCLRVVEFELAG